MTVRRRHAVLMRVVALLEMLADGRVHEARMLAPMLGVCRRTLLRDVQCLADCGFLIVDETLADVNRRNSPRAYQLVRPGQAVRILQFRKSA